MSVHQSTSSLLCEQNISVLHHKYPKPSRRWFAITFRSLLPPTTGPVPISTRLLWVPSSLTCDLYSTSCCLLFNILLLHPQLLISWIHTVSSPPAVSSLLYKTNPHTSFHPPSSKNITLPLMLLMADNYLVIVIHNEREITCDFNIYFPGVITLKKVLTHCT